MGKERLIYSRYTWYVKKESKYIRGLEIEDYEMMKCPRCGEKRIALDHGERGKCGKCELNMQPFGNSLYIWEGKDE